MNFITVVELIGCSLLGQFIHLQIKAKAIKARNDSVGLGGNPFKQLIQEDYINIMLSLTANMVLLIVLKNAKNTTYSFEFLGIEMQIDWRYLLFIFSGYTGSSFVLSLFSKLDKLKNEQLNNISILTPTKTETDMATEYVFTIPENATAIMVDEQELTIEAAAEHFAADIQGSDFVIQDSTPATLEFIVNGVSNFVGHVPRPK